MAKAPAVKAKERDLPQSCSTCAYRTDRGGQLHCAVPLPPHLNPSLAAKSAYTRPEYVCALYKPE